MGNYRGTVRCGFCRERGHNKRGCQDYTASLKTQHEQYQRWVAEETDEVLLTRYNRRLENISAQLAKRTGVDPNTGKKVNRASTRKCSYCKYKHGSWSDKGVGHTRRTCVELKDDYAESVRTNAVFRKQVLKSLRAHGLGVGALVRMQVSGYFTDPDGNENWDRREVLTMVKNISWDNIAYTNDDHYTIFAQRVDKMDSAAGVVPIALPFQLDAEGAPMRFHVTQGWNPQAGPKVGGWNPAENKPYAPFIESPVPSATINPPPQWEIGGSSSLKTHYDGKKR